MTAVQFPRLAAVFPDLASDIAELLEAEDKNLARTVSDLRFHGRCTCTPTCPVLLTAPFDSRGPWIVDLERDEQSVIWLILDWEGTSVTGIEVLDGRELVPQRT